MANPLLQTRERPTTEVTIVQEYNDRTVTLTGKLLNVDIAYDVTYDDVGPYDLMSSRFATSQQHTLSGVFDGPYTVRVVDKFCECTCKRKNCHGG